MKKTLIALFGIGAACAVCCASPFILPLLASVMISVPGWVIATVSVIAAAVVALHIYGCIKKGRCVSTCRNACGCADSACT